MELVPERRNGNAVPVHHWIFRSQGQSLLGHVELVTHANSGIGHTSFWDGGNNHNFFLESVELAIILWWIPPNPFVGVEMITTQKNEGGISHTWKI